ncbi:hypothetical protein B5M09_003115 [Aphanomyces astaci]|uniref:Kinesin motor domain-containing protein n=1 Tax=Aphanomyces astaci TaxID=112090 RepID=A0A3R7X2W9_APHAT|nr:hypothetical protein B5M09_003115 [Aphanomyces astaci]
MDVTLPQVIQTASACPNSCKKTVLETTHDDMIVMTDVQDFERMQERKSPPSGEMRVTLTVDHVFQNADEVDVIEHALNSLLTACVDGVNACLLCGGSSNTLRSTFFHGSDKAPAHAGLALTMLQHLLLHLADKHGSGGNPSPHTPRYFVRLSFVEFYEETITVLPETMSSPYRRHQVAVRLTEGPLLNKSLYAFESVCKAAASAASFPPYDASLLTRSLQQALGGDALTNALLFVAPNDHEGAKATGQVASMLQRMRTFPLAHSDRRRHHAERMYWKTKVPQSNSTYHDTNDGSQSTLALVQKAHELEGKLLQDSIDKSKLKDTIDGHVKALSESRAKVAGLVEAEVGLRKQLLDREREKLSLSKALVDCQLEHSTMLEAVEKDKFDLTTKLLNAENDLLELQMREEQHDTLLRAAQDAAAAATADKKELAIEFVALKANFVAANKALQAKSGKAQQLSVELLTLVNQKTQLAAAVDDLEKAKADGLERERKLREAMDKATVQEQALMGLVAAEKARGHSLYEEKVALEFQLKSLAVEVEARQVQFEKAAQEQAVAHHAQVHALKQAAEDQVARSMARQSRRQLDDLERSLAKRSTEAADLRTAMAREAAEMEAQTASYRLRLNSLFGNKPITTASGNEGEEAPVAAARAAWTLSFETRERELVERLAALEARQASWGGRYEVLYRRTMQTHFDLINMPQKVDDAPGDLDMWSQEAAAESDVSDMERRRMLAKVEVCTQELRLQLEKNLQSAETFNGMLAAKERDVAAVRTQLDAAIASRDQLQLQNERLLADKSTDETKDEMKRMQEMLVAQLQELKATMQAQPVSSKGENDQATDKRRSGYDENGQQLRAQIAKLEERLRGIKASHMQTVEATERRCVQLSTKTIMLEEEVVGLKNLLKVTTT